MRRWVLDTNVIVSGLLTVNGPCARLLDTVTKGRIKIVYDARILAEYRDVLCRRRLRLDPSEVMHFLEGLGGHMLVTPEKATLEGPDPGDVVFIEAALAVPDKTIVTGKVADFPEKILQGVRLLAPVQALAEMREA
jgi:uncharacterized protein